MNEEEVPPSVFFLQSPSHQCLKTRVHITDVLPPFIVERQTKNAALQNDSKEMGLIQALCIRLQALRAI